MREAVDLCQAKTGAFSKRFGREERLEYPRQDIRRDSHPGVGHRKRHEVSLELIHAVVLLQRDVERRQRNNATARHRIPRINRDVDQRQLELRDVDLDRPHI